MYFHDVPVGAVCATRKLVSDGGVGGGDKDNNGNSTSSSASSTSTVYIYTLGVLAPYRRLGLATLLLDHIVSTAKRAVGGGASSASTTNASATPTQTPTPTKHRVQLHVQTGNGAALAFYEKHGFRRVGDQPIPDYYRSELLAPGDERAAWLLELTL